MKITIEFPPNSTFLIFQNNTIPRKAPSTIPTRTFLLTTDFTPTSTFFCSEIMCNEMTNPPINRTAVVFFWVCGAVPHRVVVSNAGEWEGVQHFFFGPARNSDPDYRLLGRDGGGKCWSLWRVFFFFSWSPAMRTFMFFWDDGFKMFFLMLPSPPIFPKHPPPPPAAGSSPLRSSPNHPLRPAAPSSPPRASLPVKGNPSPWGRGSQQLAVFFLGPTIVQVWPLPTPGGGLFPPPQIDWLV